MKGEVITKKAEFGFVKGEDDKDYFFHMSEMTVPEEFDFLVIGTRVKFEPEESKKGLRAILLEIDDEV